jgi:NADP-dependent 3-hydroxy acid dehydrogenase YdfG
MKNYYENKIVWITGASSGIGWALAKELHTRGAKLAISGRNQQALQKLVDELGGENTFIQAFDATDELANKTAVENILQHFGKLDIAILNAGISLPSSKNNFAKNFKETLDVNVLGVAYGIDPVLKYFRQKDKGHLAVVGSLAGFGGVPGSAAYCASKAAVQSMLQSLTAELINTPIKVSTICPGFVKTPLTDKNNFKMPFLMRPEKAAVIMAKQLARQKQLICFPWLFSWLTRFVNILPNSLYLKLVSRVR